MSVLKMIFLSVRALIVSRADLSLELLALRQQLVVLRRTVQRPQVCNQDRLFWVVLSRIWKDWRKALVIVKPETVIKWHRQGFKMYWRWKSRTRNSGHPKLDEEIRDLIRRISDENPLWGVPRIQSELHLLGYDVAASTVAKYRIRGRKPPSQTWRTFLDNHVDQIAAVDFFTVPTISFRELFCFLVLRHDRRKVVHFNVTEHPTAFWTGQQIVEAFPENSALRYLLRDQDKIYGDEFCQRLKGLGIEEVMTAPQSPFQNPYAERIVGSIRRECLDHVMVLNENHLRAILRSYLSYYHEARPHLSLERNSPIPRQVELPAKGRVIATQQVGGLHHRYKRCA
jgi:transposase InsO family protein